MRLLRCGVIRHLRRRKGILEVGGIGSCLWGVEDISKRPSGRCSCRTWEIPVHGRPELVSILIHLNQCARATHPL